MKKTSAFVVASFLSLALCMTISSLLDDVSRFQLETLSGEEALLEKVEYHAALKAGKHVIALEMKKGHTNYQIQETDHYMEAKFQEQSMLDKNDNALYMGFKRQEGSGEAWSKVYEGSTECQIATRSLPSAQVVYTSGFSEEIKTDLSIEAAEDLEITEDYCGNVSIQMLDDDQYYFGDEGDVNAIPYEDAYYFMPVQTAYIKGRNAIYKIHEKSYEKLTRLPSDRNYEQLQLVENKLIVISWDDSKLYITTYDLSGAYLGEQAIPYEFTKDFTLNITEVADKVLLYDSTTCFVFDVTTQSLRSVPLPTGFDRIVDFKYVDDLLYVSASQQQGTKQYIYFYVLENEKQRYAGRIELLDKQEENEEFSSAEVSVIQWGYFRR